MFSEAPVSHSVRGGGVCGGYDVTSCLCVSVPGPTSFLECVVLRGVLSLRCVVLRGYGPKDDMVLRKGVWSLGIMCGGRHPRY